MTVCVSDLAAAKRFFVLLGLQEDKAVVISGEPFASYMGLKEIEADHVTLVLPGASPRFEVQLLHYRRPEAVSDPTIARLDKLGFNHICFAVDDIDAALAEALANGATPKECAACKITGRHVHPEGWIAFLQDAVSGIEIEFMQVYTEGEGGDRPQGV